MSIFALGRFKKTNKMSQPNASIEDMCIDYAQSVSLGLRYYSGNLSKDLPGGGSPPPPPTKKVGVAVLRASWTVIIFFIFS